MESTTPTIKYMGKTPHWRISGGFWQKQISKYHLDCITIKRIKGEMSIMLIFIGVRIFSEEITLDCWLIVPTFSVRCL